MCLESNQNCMHWVSQKKCGSHVYHMCPWCAFTIVTLLSTLIIFSPFNTLLWTLGRRDWKHVTCATILQCPCKIYEVHHGMRPHPLTKTQTGSLVKFSRTRVWDFVPAVDCTCHNCMFRHFLPSSSKHCCCHDQKQQLDYLFPPVMDPTTLMIEDVFDHAWGYAYACTGGGGCVSHVQLQSRYHKYNVYILVIPKYPINLITVHVVSLKLSGSSLHNQQ